MVTFEQFLLVLRACLLEAKGVEVVLGPYMLTAYLFMTHEDWQQFFGAAMRRLHIKVKVDALTKSSTILDLYYASLHGSQYEATAVMDFSGIRQSSHAIEPASASLRIH